MEESIQPSVPLKRILITGPESTGKSDLAAALALHYGGTLIPEYARYYIENLNRPYEYSDVEQIARQQEKDYLSSEKETGWFFFDTWLIITKVWLDIRFNSVPHWMNARISQAHFDMILLCATDIPWIPDPVRENGGQMREKLFDQYKYEFDTLGWDWNLVSGKGDERFKNTVQLINHMNSNGTD